MLSLKELEMHNLLDDCTCHLIKQNVSEERKLQDRFENISATRMTDEYFKRAQKAIKKTVQKFTSGKGKVTKKEIKSLQKIMNTELSDSITNDSIDRVNRDIRRYYIADKNLFVNEFGLKPIEKGIRLLNKAEPKIEAVFNIRDKEIVEGIQQQNAFAGKNLYVNGYQVHVNDVIAQTVTQQGLSRTVAGQALEANLVKATGLSPGKIALKVVPKSFHGTAQSYYKGLSSSTYNRAQNYNRIAGMNQAGIEGYEIQAIIDRRTSQICIQMNGRRFTIKQGNETIDAVLSAPDAEALRAIAPWRKNLSEFGIAGNDAFKKGPRAKAFSDKLADAGMALPLYHFRCRTQVRPIF